MSLLCKSLRNCVSFSYKTRDYCFKHVTKHMASFGSTSSIGRSSLRLGLLGLGTGAIVGTGYSIRQLNKPRGHISNEQTVIAILNEQEVPKLSPSRQIRRTTNQTDLKLTLYQYQTCPFCCKVRAFLDYHGFSYDIIEVDPVLKQAIKWSPYKKVPILLVKTADGYQPLNDSSMIMSALSSYLQDSKKNLSDIVKYYPSINFVDEGGTVKHEVMNRYFLMLDQRDNSEISSDVVKEERKWRKWVDDVFVHTVSPNVYRTRAEALQAFNWFSDVGEWDKHFPAWERYFIIYVGAFVMWRIGKRLKSKYNLKDDVRESLYDESNRFAKAIKSKGTTFMGGNKPNLADLSMYGVLNSIEGCDAFKDVTDKSHIKLWYYTMKEAVNNHRGTAYSMYA